MIHILKTNADNPDFKRLVSFLNADLAQRDGEHHPLTQFNEIDSIKNVILAYEDKKVIACGVIKEYNAEYMEIKRVYVLPEERGKGIAKSILHELENWAKGQSYSKFVLVMGLNQPEAKALYLKNGYILTTDFGKLTKIKDSLCFVKENL